MRQRLSCLAFGLTIAMVLCASSVLAATPVSARVQGTLVIGDARFPGGLVQVETPAFGNLATVKVDGVVVARVFRHALDRPPAGADVRLAFHEDRHGDMHLVGVRWTAKDGSNHTEERLFGVAGASTTTMMARAAL